MSTNDEKSFIEKQNKSVYLTMLVDKQKSDFELAWNPEIEADFINEVFKIRNLWDFKNPLYTKKSAKKFGYEQISKIMKARWPSHKHLMNGDSLMRKFSKLKAYFIKECRKSKKFKVGKDNLEFCSKWIHFDRMKFLNSLYKAFSAEIDCSLNDSPVHFIKSEFVVDEAENPSEVDASQNRFLTVALKPVPVSKKELDSVTKDFNSSAKKMKTENEVEITEEKFIKLEEAPMQISSREEMPSTVDLNSYGRNVKKTVRERDLISKEVENSVKDSKEDEKDPDEFYGKFIISELKKIKDPMQKDLARIDIQNVLMKYKYNLDK